MLFELRLEALEQRECIGGGAGKSGQHLVVMEASYLAGRRLDDDVAERDLAVAAQRDRAIAAHRQNRRAVKDVHRDCVVAAGPRWLNWVS